MKYITLIMVSVLAAYFAYISYMFFSGIINGRKANYGDFSIKMIVVALVSYGILALVGTIISFERIIIIVALVVLAIRYIRRRN